MDPTEKSIITPKSARYYFLGELSKDTSEIVIVFHGYAMLAKHFVKKFSSMVNSNRVVVAPEGLSKFYWEQMSGKVVASWMTSEDRFNEIKDQVNYLDLMLKEVLNSIQKSQLKISIIAFSQGVSTAARWLINSKNIEPNKIVFWAGSIPEEYFLNDKVKAIETFYVYGDKDPYVKKKDVDSKVRQINKIGFDFQIIEFEGLHEIKKEIFEKINI